MTAALGESKGEKLTEQQVAIEWMCKLSVLTWNYLKNDAGWKHWIAEYHPQLMLCLKCNTKKTIHDLWTSSRSTVGLWRSFPQPHYQSEVTNCRAGNNPFSLIAVHQALLSCPVCRSISIARLNLQASLRHWSGRHTGLNSNLRFHSATYHITWITEVFL